MAIALGVMGPSGGTEDFGDREISIGRLTVRCADMGMEVANEPLSMSMEGVLGDRGERGEVEGVVWSNNW